MYISVYQSRSVPYLDCIFRRFRQTGERSKFEVWKYIVKNNFDLVNDYRIGILKRNRSIIVTILLGPSRRRIARGGKTCNTCSSFKLSGCFHQSTCIFYLCYEANVCDVFLLRSMGLTHVVVVVVVVDDDDDVVDVVDDVVLGNILEISYSSTVFPSGSKS